MEKLAEKRLIPEMYHTRRRDGQTKAQRTRITGSLDEFEKIRNFVGGLSFVSLLFLA